MSKTFIKGYFHVENGVIQFYSTSKSQLVDWMEMTRFSDYSVREMRGFNSKNLDAKIEWMIGKHFMDDAILLNPSVDMLNHAIQTTTGAY